MKNESTCAQCHGLFESVRSDALTCGPRCRQAYKRARDRERKMMVKLREDWTPRQKQAVIDAETDVRNAREKQSQIRRSAEV